MRTSRRAMGSNGQLATTFSDNGNPASDCPSAFGLRDEQCSMPYCIFIGYMCVIRNIIERNTLNHRRVLADDKVC